MSSIDDLSFRIRMLYPDGHEVNLGMMPSWQVPLTGSKYDGMVVYHKEWSFDDSSVDMILFLGSRTTG